MFRIYLSRTVSPGVGISLLAAIEEMREVYSLCKQIIVGICKFPSTFDKIGSNDEDDASKYEQQYSLKG